MDTFLAALSEMGFFPPANALDLFEEYAQLLAHSNRHMNLVSASDLPHLWGRHLLDSISPLLLRAVPEEGDLLDIGSGAGLPGIPLAICAPRLRITMVESIGKKARFIERAIDTLGLCNASVQRCRFEAIDDPHRYDFCTARAVSSVRDILPKVSHLVKSGGKAIFYKSRDFESELEGIDGLLERASFKPPVVFAAKNHETFERRVLLVFEKI